VRLEVLGKLKKFIDVIRSQMSQSKLFLDVSKCSPSRPHKSISGCYLELGSLVSAMNRQRVRELENQDSVPFRGRVFFSSSVSRPAVEPTQPPIQWVPEALSLGIKLTIHLYLMSRL
jgi:hypothetical protein